MTQPYESIIEIEDDMIGDDHLTGTATIYGYSDPQGVGELVEIGTLHSTVHAKHLRRVLVVYDALVDSGIPDVSAFVARYEAMREALKVADLHLEGISRDWAANTARYHIRAALALSAPSPAPKQDDLTGKLAAALQRSADVMNSAMYYAVGRTVSDTTAILEALKKAIEQANAALAEVKP